MQFNLDNHLAKFHKPWDFHVAHAGQTYTTRELTSEDVARLQSIQNASAATQLEFAAGLFNDPKPDLASWPDETVIAFIASVIGYYTARRRELAASIHEEVTKVMQAGRQRRDGE
jgi:hypothetical protein